MTPLDEILKHVARGDEQKTHWGDTPFERALMRLLDIPDPDPVPVTIPPDASEIAERRQADAARAAAILEPPADPAPAPTEKEPANPFDRAPWRVRGILGLHGINCVADLGERTVFEVAALRGIGHPGWAWIYKVMADHGVSFRPTEPADRASFVPFECVYFIQGGPRIKIGITDCIQARFSSLSTASPLPLVLLGVVYCAERVECYALERELHERFNAHRSHGEWFHDCQEIWDYIAAHAQEAVAS